MDFVPFVKELATAWVAAFIGVIFLMVGFFYSTPVCSAVVPNSPTCISLVFLFCFIVGAVFVLFAVHRRKLLFND